MTEQPHPDVRESIILYRYGRIGDAELESALLAFPYCDQVNHHPPYSPPWWELQKEITTRTDHWARVQKAVTLGYVPQDIFERVAAALGKSTRGVYKGSY